MRSGVKRRDAGQCVSLKLECNVSKGLYAETAFSRTTGLSNLVLPTQVYDRFNGPFPEW